jgi:NAD(P)-dependent dehydrogenase (short-subunit alcohol dehydrogenase family)
MQQVAIYPDLAAASVFITGGATGIGADMVRAFVAQGARVAFVDVNADACAALRASLTTPAIPPEYEVVDVCEVATLQGAMARLAARCGAFSVLVNNVANDERHLAHEVTPQYFDDRVAVNLRPAFFATQAVVAGMVAAGGGSIINLGSTIWRIKGAGMPVYGMCKAAITGLTRNMARELGAQNIRINTVSPGWVMTERQLALWVDAEGEREIEANQCLQGRLQGDDIAQMVLFLASCASRMISAQDFVVDAGWT